MWISQRGREQKMKESPAGLGQVTLGGDPAGVYLKGERRELPVCSPAGFWWKPEAGQDVLIIKTGVEGEQLCVAGAKQEEAPAELAAGETLMGNENAWIKIGHGGQISASGKTAVTGEISVDGDAVIQGAVKLSGDVYIGEETLDAFIKNIVSKMI